MSDYYDKKLFKEMFEMACEGEPVGGARVVAQLTDGQTSTFGYNQMKSHPFQKRFGKNEDCIYLHAEIDAIKNWFRFNQMNDLTDYELYVMRVKREGAMVTGLAKPCEGCQRAIATFGISCVYYTEDNATGFTSL